MCKLHNFCELADPLPLFTFTHPSPPPSLEENARYSVKTFVSRGDATIHGVIGYFHCVLYRDVCMSIVPESHSEGMISWFPLYFPIRNPIPVCEGEKIEVHFWRCVSSTKIWYEWSISVNDLAVTPIHNPNGRSYSIGLTI